MYNHCEDITVLLWILVSQVQNHRAVISTFFLFYSLFEFFFYILIKVEVEKNFRYLVVRGNDVYAKNDGHTETKNGEANTPPPPELKEKRN